VTDDAFAAGRCDGGRYRALSGVLVLPASLTAPGAARRLLHSLNTVALRRTIA